jgi:hypothetical protein
MFRKWGSGSLIMKRAIVAAAADERDAKRPRLDELAQAFPFLDLIIDMQAEVLRHLRKVGDRSALARTCKVLHARINPCFPQKWAAAWSVEPGRAFIELFELDIPQWPRGHWCEWGGGALLFQWIVAKPTLTVWRLHALFDGLWFAGWSLYNPGNPNVSHWTTRHTLDEIVATPTGREWLAFLSVNPHSPENG